MRLLLHSSTEPALDLALEEAIQLGLEQGTSPPTWRLWQSAVPALILGTGQSAERELNLEEARNLGVPVLRRHSGGGAVLIGPGVINYSAFYRITELSGAQTITGAMQAGLQPILTILQGWGMQASLAGLSDVVVKGRDGLLRKIAGNAQARKRVSVLVHGTILARPDWALLERLLRFPSRPPDYRVGRGHRDFLTSLAECGAPDALPPIADALNRQVEVNREDVLPGEREEAVSLLRTKYGTVEWNLRR